jgi:hypothetical protein
MGAFFTALFAKFSAVVAWFGSLAVAVFTAFSDLFKDIFAWVFEQVLGVAQGLINAVDLSGITQYSNLWQSGPAQTLEVLSALGLGTAFGIILAAIGIRLILQLIPFVRLGS